MKIKVKFADKLSLESTQYEDLQHLVADAIQFAYDVTSNGCVADTEPREAGNNEIKIAGAFCKMQDEEKQ
jgi:hypothetical protein